MNEVKLRRIILRDYHYILLPTAGEINGVFEVYLSLSKIYYNWELDHFASLKGRPTSPLADVVNDRGDLIFFSL